MEKHLGRIESVYFGLGGYQGIEIGIHFTFSFGGCRIGTSVSTSSPEKIKWNKRCEWTEESRSDSFNEIVRYVAKLLHEAKVDRIEKLKGIPVEITIDSMTFKSFRILTEVL